MKYIIPKNYDFKPKLFGIIEYRFGIFILSLSFILIFILNNINILAIIKIQILLLIIIPILMIGTIGVRGEKLFDILKILLLYALKQKVFFFSKELSNEK